jgi:hypothetical protein
LELLAEQFESSWPGIGPAIALAGAAYPVILALGSLLVIVATLFNLAFTGSPVQPNELGRVVVFLFVGGTVGAGIGLVWASIVCIVTLPLVYIFVLSLRLRGSLTRLGGFAGGLVGCVAVLPFVHGVYSPARGTSAEFVFMLFVGPGLTTILGQIGGAWGGWRERWYERAVASAAISEGPRTFEQPANGSNNGGSPSYPHIQFGIRHLLVFGIWVSLLLTTIRLSGLDYQIVLPLVIGWLMYQAVTLWIGGWLASWFGRWKARRQSRST